ncbi:MAG: hypothetical protein KAH32_03850 [Chlamydiia bacterium]|nr:hypothetical protein [Chlamydiia bacterium]
MGLPRKLPFKLGAKAMDIEMMFIGKSILITPDDTMREGGEYLPYSLGFDLTGDGPTGVITYILETVKDDIVYINKTCVKL